MSISALFTTVQSSAETSGFSLNHPFFLVVLIILGFSLIGVGMTDSPGWAKLLAPLFGFLILVIAILSFNPFSDVNSDQPSDVEPSPAVSSSLDPTETPTPSTSN